MSGHDAGRCGGQLQIAMGTAWPMHATASVISSRG